MSVLVMVSVLVGQAAAAALALAKLARAVRIWRGEAARLQAVITQGAELRAALFKGLTEQRDRAQLAEDRQRWAEAERAAVAATFRQLTETSVSPTEPGREGSSGSSPVAVG